MNELKNIVKIRTTSGSLHYYQFYPNETFLDLRNYLANAYQYEGILRFIYNDHEIDDNQLLADCNDPNKSILCIIPSKVPTYSVKSLKSSISHEYSSFQYSQKVDLPPRPELQT